MTEKDSIQPRNFNLVEVENPDVRGYALDRRIGQIYIQKFGTIKITGFDSDHFCFSTLIFESVYFTPHF